MSDSKPGQVRELETEFRTFFPSERLQGLTASDIEAIRTAYVDERLSWEVENRGHVRILTLVSFITLFVLVGLAIWYFVHRWEQGHMDSVQQKTLMRIRNATTAA
jgi:hypothetical protein